jgi:CrcB protein
VTPTLLVGVGGALGAMARHALYRRLERDARVPRATLAVNVLGSFVLAVVVAVQATDSVALFLGTGACGAFTTFSSFSVETFDRLETGDYAGAAANGALNLVASLAAVGAGFLLASLTA